MRKICVFTATRAEYGLLSPLMRAIKAESKYELQLIVSGAHLSPEYGMTVQQIENDGFVVNRRIEMLLSSDTAVGSTKSLGLATIGIADAFNELTPDLIVLLGDRYELIATASAALLANIPIIHLHGGELSEGAIDDVIRHVITKMSRLHFTSTEEYRERVISLGEHPDTVYNVGAIGIDVLQGTSLLTEHEIRSALGLGAGPVFLTTFHPVTTQPGGAEKQLKALLEAFDAFPSHQIVFTKANADPEGRTINRMLEEYCKKSNGRAQLCSSLGQLRYFSLAAICDAVIGNSSSGIIEVPSLKIPTINIGDRQAGRISAATVLHTLVDTDDIVLAIRNALSPAFRHECKQIMNPYGNGTATKKIMEVLNSITFPLAKKVFYSSKGQE